MLTVGPRADESPCERRSPRQVPKAEVRLPRSSVERLWGSPSAASRQTSSERVACTTSVQRDPFLVVAFAARGKVPQFPGPSIVVVRRTRTRLTGAGSDARSDPSGTLVGVSAQPAGICMFCGATGVTKAHVFAKSWTSLFDDPNDPREHEVVHRYEDPTTGERQVLKRAKTFALVSRKVCGACNSGWLSELEERVRPLMARFAANTPITLTADAQADLALWSAASSLIAMSNDRDAAEFADPALAHEVYRERRPPNGMDIWLGANSHGEMAWFRSHSLKLAHAPEQAGAWGATITFGYAVFHMVFHGLPNQRMRLRADAHRHLRRIWMTQDRVVWPPKLVMRPHDLTPLALAIGEQSSFERAAPRG